MTQEVKLRRVKCKYKTDNARFLLDSDFSQQYHHYYRKRLIQAKAQLVENCKLKWGDNKYPILSLAGLAEMCAECDDADALILGDTSDPFECSLSLPSPVLRENKQLGTMSRDNVTKSVIDDEVENLFSIYNEYPSSQKRRRTLSNQDETEPKPSTSEQNLQDPEKTPPKSAYPITSTQKTLDSTPPAGPSVIFMPATGESTKVLRPFSGNCRCVIIGTIFKRMKLQPDVVRELSSGNFNINCERYSGNYTSEDDKLILEDVDESVFLTGNINPKDFVTGIVVALLGRPIKDGSEFFVVDVCYAEVSEMAALRVLSSQSQSPVPKVSQQSKISQNQSNESIYIMVISDLSFHQHMGKKNVHVKALQRLIDFVWGGVRYENDERSSRIARILVVGNSVSDKRFEQTNLDCEQAGEASVSYPPLDIALEMKKVKQLPECSGSILAIKHMDNFFAELSKTIDVDVMPGPNDPATHLLPQQPFHPCMLPKACVFKSFNCTTNPHHAIYNNQVEILATSGQNIDIVSKFSDIKDPIEVMKCHLKWGHSAPGAPDNLYSVPYVDQDPFTIDFKPDVYIAGCQEEFSTDYYNYDSNEGNILAPKGYASDFPNINLASTHSSQIINCDRCIDDNFNQLGADKKKRTLLVTIPKFFKSFSCVLINLKNLETELIKFNE